MKKFKFQAASRMEAPSTVLRFGLTEIYAPKPSSSAQVDVVFVHGLNGDPKLTWTSKSTNVFWPKDLLPRFIEDLNIRVLVYGYDADIVSFVSKGRGATKDRIHNHAERLVADLFANRRIRKAAERPIIFLAHSLGGIVVKRALIYSAEISGVKTEHLRSVAVSTYGIFFLGTPHKGSDLGQWGSYLESLCNAIIPKKLLDSQPHLLEALKTNSETLQNVDRQFSMLMDQYHLFFFHEGKPTDFKGTYHFIVEEESAAPTLPDVERASIQADHSAMCKFDNENSPGFDLIVDGIQRYSEDAPPTVRQRWLAEKQERLNRKLRKAKELVPGAIDDIRLSESGRIDPPSITASPSHSIIDMRESLLPKHVSAASSTDFLSTTSRPTEPFFIVPPGFRTNPIFVGMQKEMQLLDQHLFEDRREITTACVLIHGHPGAGKSHLVRQYIFENRQKFPGGVFWVNAHLIEEVENDFWQISQKVIAKVSPEMMLGSQGPPGYRRYADTVRKWFESRQEWLMVFDGIAIEKEKDLEKLYRFIPDSPNSNIIYISRSRRFEAMDRLLNPVAVKVRPLDESEGRDLLFKELHVERPRAAQLKSATDLVNKIGGLPLAINAIAKRIADTHVPIEKYSMKSYSMDPILGATYRLVVDDLRKNRHKEALNLISIICFFGPHIPVEMIHLGLKALKMAGIEVTSGENGEEPDLNITFGILMRHALIERNEPDDTTSLSGSRDSLVEPEPIDMLKMHTVIQKFCSDSLNASKRLPIWLNHACQLLICSYHEADARIRGRPEPPRLSDYRQYSIHGEQLRQHTLSYESKRQPLEHLRVQLDGTLDNIREKIRSMEPRSSQESVVQQEFQCSIFDRTNTSSSSSNSQTDDASPTNSSHRLYAEANELTDPTFRRTSDSSTRTKVSDRSSQTSAHARIDTCPRSSTAEEAKLRTSQPMQKNPSDTPTLRPSETKPITYGVARQVGFSTPSTTLNTEAAMGSMFRVPSEENPTTSRPSPSALSSLTSFQRPKQQAAKLYESFGPKLFSYGRGQGSQEIAHRGWQSAADEIIETQIPPRISSAPDQSGHQPPFASLAYARGRTGPTYAQHLRSDGQSPSRSEFVRAKSPLAAPMMPPFRDAQRSEALVCNPGYSTTGDTNSKLPLPSQTLVSTSSQGDTSKSLALRSNTMPSTSEQNDVGAPLMEYPLLQSSALSENVGDTLIVYRSSSLTNQPIAFHLAPSTSVTNLQQLPSQQAYQRQSFSIGPAVQDSLFPTSFQSPQVGPIRASESSRLRWLDGSSAQISPQFASNNSSPTMPPHMFSSIHSDVGPAIHTDKEPRARPNLTAIVKNNARETTASHQSRQPQVQSAPLVYSHFSTSNSVVAPSPLSTGAISLSRPTSSGSKTPSGCITDGQGLGIGEFPGQISIPSFAIVPPSDPRRRLRAREGRLTERDVNILVRLPSEENHPLAPKREHFAGVAESGPAPLAPKGPDGQTIISSDDLRAWKPAKRNVGMRSSAPYPEISRFPAGGQSVSVNTLLDMEPEHRRRRSAPESPGWSTVRDSDGWLGQG